MVKIQNSKLKEWCLELSKLSRAIRICFDVHENVTRAKTGEERRLCVLLNQIETLREFISYLIEGDKEAVDEKISTWKKEVKYKAKEKSNYLDELFSGK